MSALTKRERDVLDFLREHIGRERISPTYSEIANQFGWRSPGTVHEVISSLELKGCIRRTPMAPRGIELTAGEIRVICPGCGGDDHLCHLCSGTGKVMAVPA